MFLVIVVSNNIVCQPASLPPKEDGLETADPKTPPPPPACCSPADHAARGLPHDAPAAAAVC